MGERGQREDPNALHRGALWWGGGRTEANIELAELPPHCPPSSGEGLGVAGLEDEKEIAHLEDGEENEFEERGRGVGVKYRFCVHNTVGERVRQSANGEAPKSDYAPITMPAVRWMRQR